MNARNGRPPPAERRCEPMILVSRHAEAAGGPFQASLRMEPATRVDLIDVRGVLRREFGTAFTRYPKASYISDHTTAGYLDRRLANVLQHDGDNIHDYLQVFRKLFPPEAGYVHDELHLRKELSDEQRAREPRNGDSHLTFMGGGLRSCVSYELREDTPVWFVELDGVHAGGIRRRHTTVLGYEREEDVLRMQLLVPSSPHPIDARNLRDPRFRFIGRLHDLIRAHGVTFGRFDISLPVTERHAGLTVNEYETLLMGHDLRDVLANPLHFMARLGREALRAPSAIPAQARNYARYDALRLLNELMDRVRVRRSAVERLVNRALAVPVSHFLRMKRRISLPILGRRGAGAGRIGWGAHQSPILVQWRAPARPTRTLNVRLVRFVAGGGSPR